MNSVLEIGEYIMFMYKGEKVWEGSKKDILDTEVKALQDFIFANKFDTGSEYDDTELEKYCKKNNITSYLKTSAKCGTGIEEGMTQIVDLLVSKEFSSQKNKDTRRIDLDRDTYTEEPKKCC